MTFDIRHEPLKSGKTAIRCCVQARCASGRAASPTSRRRLSLTRHRRSNSTSTEKPEDFRGTKPIFLASRNIAPFSRRTSALSVFRSCCTARDSAVRSSFSPMPVRFRSDRTIKAISAFDGDMSTRCRIPDISPVFVQHANQLAALAADIEKPFQRRGVLKIKRLSEAQTKIVPIGHADKRSDHPPLVLGQRSREDDRTIFAGAAILPSAPRLAGLASGGMGTRAVSGGCSWRSRLMP